MPKPTTPTNPSVTQLRNRTNTKDFDPIKYSPLNPYMYTAAEQHAILTKFKLKQPVYIWQNNLKPSPPYWDTLNPDSEIQFNFMDNIYSTTLPTQCLPPITNIPARHNQFDVQVFPPDHVCHNRIIYDTDAREYYDKTMDIFLSDDDISFYGLRLYPNITSPLPSPLPENYWDAVQVKK